MTENLLKNGLFIGASGTVVHIYPKAKAYAVEFKKNDNSITVETVKLHQIKKRTHKSKINYGAYGGLGSEWDTGVAGHLDNL